MDTDDHGASQGGTIPADPGRAPTKRRGSVTRLRILVVDDDAAIAGLVAEILAINGHIVCGTEATEAGAVAAAARHRPDLVIIDLTLGTGSGLRAMAQITRDGPVPHVFISGRRDPGRTEILLKPFSEAALLQAITRAMAAAPQSRLSISQPGP